MTLPFERFFKPDHLPWPIELKRGAVYVIESEGELTEASFKDLEGYLKTFTQKTGCEFLILDAGLHIALRSEKETELHG
jgi:hypothetical protein